MFLDCDPLGLVGDDDGDEDLQHDEDVLDQHHQHELLSLRVLLPAATKDCT